MSRIVLDSVSKTYDEETTAVESFDLEIQDGEFITIVGPSGSGKSTVLRMIAGLETITGGAIHIGGQLVNDVQPQDRDIAMVFQNYALYPHMTVEQNLSYGLELTSDLDAETIDERVTEAVEMLGIEDQLSKKPSQLSGGQQQRVATGRAIVRDPAAFLMDEPLSNLDAKLRTTMRTELQRLQEDLETTTVYVTHDQEEAMTMSDRVVVINEGAIQQVGTPREVFAQPTNRFVGEFIGSPSMNFFDVTISGTTLSGNDISVSVSESLATRLEDAQIQRGHLGIRPEHMRFANVDDRNAISAVLDVQEPVGDDNYLYLRTGDTEFTMRVLGSVDHEEGDSITVAFDESEIHLFDQTTGRNLLVDPSAPTTTETSAETP